jgi:hypothetical protein
MKEDGFVDREWRRYLERSADIDCDTESDLTSDNVDSPRLSLRDMAGLFIFHGSLTAIAVGMFVFHTYVDRKTWRFIKRKPQEASGQAKTAEKPDGAVNGLEAAHGSTLVSDLPPRIEQCAIKDKDLLQLRDQMQKWVALLDEKMGQEPCPPNDP